MADTAGIRQKNKIKEDLEFYSVMRSVRAIEYCDVVILLFDATGLRRTGSEYILAAQRNNKGIVILANKWDLVEKDHTTTKDMEAYIRKQCEPL